MHDWTKILEAIGAAQGPDKEQGRALLEQCWDATEAGDHAQRCVLAHYLADTASELDEEIQWDETAVAEHRFIEDADLLPLGIPSAAGFVPSLELNLADGHHRRGDRERARRHLERGRAAAGALGDDGYGAMIRAGLDALAQRLAGSDSNPPRTSR